MGNLENYFKRLEKNYQNKDKKEKVDFHLNGEVYELSLLNRSEKFELFFSRKASTLSTNKDIYEWLKPCIYKCFNLKEIAKKAKEEEKIASYYDIIELLFDPFEIEEILSFIIEKNNLVKFKNEEMVEIAKKQ